MKRKLLRKLLGVCLILLIILSGLEVMVRAWGYSERHIYDPIYTSFTMSDEIPYIHKPNLVAAHARGLAVINTDSLGLRARNARTTYGAKQANEYRVAIVGDSYTFGEGVPRTQDTFAQVLEDTLNRRQQAMTVKVLNYGASAYSVKEMAATLHYRMLDVQPDLVMMAIIPSDFDLARTPTIDATGYLIDQKLSYFSPPGSVIRRVLRGVHLAYVLREIGLRASFKPPNMGQMFSRGDIPESYEYIRQFKKVAEQGGLSYAIVLLPMMQRNAWVLMKDQLSRDTVKYIDLSFLQNEFTEEQYRASRFDPHPSSAVHHRIGESLADYVLRQQVFAP